MENDKEIINEEINDELVENQDTMANESADSDKSNNEETVKTSEGNENIEEDELDMVKKQTKKLQEELDTTKDTLLRLRAEYDNYRRRSIKEKEGIYSDAYVDVIKEILPIIDNLERAMAADGALEDLKKGIEMTIKGCQDAFSKLGIEEIDATGEFDPNLHNAVMHVEDDNLDKNVIAEVFQKGYKKDEKIIRHTMVKVAN